MQLVTFGEAMLRFSPPRDESLERAEAYRVEIAGTEANVATALARLGWQATWISRLPSNPLGRHVAGRLRQHGVDTSSVIWSDGRMGLYFVEMGAPPRPAQVIYDRAGSAFAGIRPEELSPSILDGADLLHLTGISPALSRGASAAVDLLLNAATERGVRVSFDLNYRARLWSPVEARATIEPLLARVHLIFASSADARVVLGVDGPPEAQAGELAGRYPNARIVLTAGINGSYSWDGELHHRPIVSGDEIDRIGRGDAFCAGFLAGGAEGGTETGLAWGTAMAALTQTYRGDVTWSTREDVLAVVEGASSPHFR